MAADRPESPASTSTEHLFDKFMDKLHENRSGKHPVSYYAYKLCVTPQYQSKAVITEAKVLLKDTDASSETLNFPTDTSSAGSSRKGPE